MRNFIKAILIFVLFLSFFLPSSLVLAHQNEATTEAKTTFEIFWPLTAGRTIDDKLYFLKTLKENLRGALIFGSAQKAEYAVLLGTKRVLEADKLIKDGKKDFADKTLKKALEELNIAQKNIDSAKAKRESFGSNLATMQTRLDSLGNFIPSLDSNLKGDLISKVKALQNSL